MSLANIREQMRIALPENLSTTAEISPLFGVIDVDLVSDPPTVKFTGTMIDQDRIPGMPLLRQGFRKGPAPAHPREAGDDRGARTRKENAGIGCPGSSGAFRRG